MFEVELAVFGFAASHMWCQLWQQSMAATSLKAKCSSTGKYDCYAVWTGTACQIKETFMFVGEGFEVQSASLSLPTCSEKGGGAVAVIWDGCTSSDRYCIKDHLLLVHVCL